METSSKQSIIRTPISLGSGYRIYFKELDDVIVLILAGSDKSDQTKTIKKANKYYEEYINRSKK